MKALVLILALALQAGPSLPPEEEARAQDLMREVRCMVCAGQSIADSDAAMAQDMRVFVRERVAAGQSDREVRDALVERFGHEVLLRPRLEARTAPLWIAPLIFLVLGGGLLYATMRKRM
ncbi:cytochrome c-type biogenesis protein CcmH [Marinicauda algicola]|uniref:Cytochrome c-type biogenesis protein n=1 Tax=Marinicauda algicola TaxID=2029849 RepID=A0A4S2H2X7_9PROT|nr:cytochrome c-type biogenesis protein [Marinicauda algicola]TGY89970.1 cytochrome c-type biogenesis protein CcmH [Marinicauda algicola]